MLRNIASSSSFFRFRSDFLARISYVKYLELKEFNKTIIPFALVGYETGYSQLGATRQLSYIQRTLPTTEKVPSGPSGPALNRG